MVTTRGWSGSSPATNELVIDHQYDDRTERGDDDTHDQGIRTTDPEQVNDEPADERADQAEDDVEHHSLARLVYDLASKKAGNQTDYQPRHNSRDHIAVCRSIDLGKECSEKIHITFRCRKNGGLSI
jgi:hypothetical protein